ncbi:alpha/beta fold hydrolase [Citricoccus parietis]|uniref:Alpha/beta fold hydrolase n=1 Tax=Citricoccus parietis TaxID=592307 RepID=A0ABV6F881_9MICC
MEGNEDQLDVSGLTVVRHRPSEEGAPRVVIVHGSMDTSRSFAGLARNLGEFEVLRYDRRGYGDNLLPSAPAPRFRDHVNDLLAVLGDRPAYVLGHSLGGAVTLTAAAHAARSFLGVMVYEAPLPWTDWWPAPALPSRSSASEAEVRQTAEAFLHRLMGTERWESWNVERRELFLGWAPAWASELQDASLDGAPFQAEDLTVPLLVSYGTATDERHRRGALEIAQRTGAPLVPLEGGTHAAPHLMPQELAAVVRGFVSSHEHAGQTVDR